MTIAEAEQILAKLQSQGIIEILILSGEVHPKSDRRPLWFQRIYELGKLALEMGFLPHTNAGSLSFAEMAQLKTVNVSLGLMLEQMVELEVHRHAPSKVAAVRLQQLQWAGELRIPFTTGLLMGIGETEADWVTSLEAIAHVHQQYGHIQEVILQPHSLGQQQIWSGQGLSMAELIRGVAIARQILPANITIQVPPNLIDNPSSLQACLQAGARDLGGIGPKDEVNPDYPHPQDLVLAHHLQQAGWQLQPRLPIYPHHDDWLTEPLQSQVKQWRNRLAALPSHNGHPDRAAASEIQETECPS